MKPSDFPPPFDAREFVAAPSDPEDERIEVGVLIVGAGPAGLACAIRLGQLLEGAPELAVAGAGLRPVRGVRPARPGVRPAGRPDTRTDERP